MNINWFKDPANVAYIKRADLQGLETGFKLPGLGEALDAFQADPGEGSAVFYGLKRSCVTMLIPDKVFGEHLDMGENVWLYFGPMQPCYAIYEPWTSDPA